MSVQISERVRRLIDSYHRSVGYTAPELQRGLVEQLIADVLTADREDRVSRAQKKKKNEGL